MKYFPRLLLVLLLLGLGLRAAVATPSVEEVVARIAELQQHPEGDPARDSLLPLYQQTKAMLDAAQAHRAEVERQSSFLASGPSTVRKLEAELAALSRPESPPPLPGNVRQAPAMELQRMTETAVNERAALETKLNSLELRDRSLEARPAEISQIKAEVTTRIAAIEVERAGLDARDESELVRARQGALEAEVAAREAELEALNAELLSHSLRLEINAVRHRLAEARLTRASAVVSQYEQLLLERRAEDLRRIQADAENALRETESAHPLVRKLAEENAHFSEMLSSLLNDQSEAVQARSEYNRQRTTFAQAYARSRQRAQLGVTSASLGRVLVEQRRKLPEGRTLARQARLSEARIGRVGMLRIEIDEQLVATRQAARQPLEQLAAAHGATDALDETATQRAKSLLQDQAELLRTLDENQSSCLRSLDTADFELQQLRAVVEDYRAFLDERLLWLPNAPPLSRQVLVDLVSSSQWLLSPANWTDTWGDVSRGFERAWPLAIATLLLALALWRARPRLRSQLARLSGAVAEPVEDSVRNTLQALALTTLWAAPMPLVLLTVARLLTAGFASGEFSIALGQVAERAAWLWFGFGWMLALLAPGGVAVGHFAWPAASCEAVRRRWRRLGQVFVPMWTVASVFEWSSNPAFQYSFRRVCLLVAMVAAAAFVSWLTRAEGVMHRAMVERAPRYWLTRSRPLWSLAAVGVPVALVVLSALGYCYAALQLGHLYLETLALLLGAGLLYALAVRWLRVAQQRITLESMMEPAAGTPVRDTEYPADFAAMNAQARLVFRNVIGWCAAFGLYFIWRDVMPALSGLEQVTLWEISVKDAESVAHLVPITLASIVVAVLIATVSVLAARNLPSVVEIALLQRLPMHRGSRYAVHTLLRYGIAALGVGLVLSTLGLRWSQVQWLIAALGVGLGFGLQEIFANFVSGLILLFERPIRVGDFVTIGELSGRVARIQIRATTICDNDNREIIVPNRNFITDRFVNWTLTDAITRLTLEVGVAHGTDLDRALGLMQEIALENPKVLRDPAPAVVFKRFGESAIDLELQVHARDLLHRVDLRHELNGAIYRAFREAGIEIPFPQRDLHLRTLPPGFKLG